MSGNAHVRCEAGENLEMISKDYLSLLPKIESAEMMFSASRSRRLSIVPVIQSLDGIGRNTWTYPSDGSAEKGKEYVSVIWRYKDIPTLAKYKEKDLKSLGGNYGWNRTKSLRA